MQSPNSSFSEIYPGKAAGVRTCRKTIIDSKGVISAVRKFAGSDGTNVG